MSIFSKLRRDASAAERKAQQTSTRDIARKAKQRARELRRKASRDASRAEETARRKKDEVKRKARQDVKTARRGDVSSLASGAGSAARSVASRIEIDDESMDRPESTAEIVERAGAAAQLRAPMDASLDPGTNGPALEAFATAQPMSVGAADPMGGSADRPDDSGELLADEFVTGGDGGGDSMGVAVGVSMDGDGFGDLESEFFGGDD